MLVRLLSSPRLTLEIPTRGGSAVRRSLVGLVVASMLLAGCDSAPSSPRPAASGAGAEEIAERIAEVELSSVAEAYEVALAEPDPLIRHMLLASVYGRADATNIRRLAEVLDARANPRSGPEAQVIGALWGRIDPEGALAETLGWERPMIRELASREVMDVAIARGGGAGLVEILEGLETQIEPDSLKTSRVALCEALFEGGENDLGLAFVERIGPDEEFRSLLLARSVLAGGRHDLEALIRWTEEGMRRDQGDRETFTELSILLLKLLVRSDYDRGREWFEEYFAGGAASDRGLAALMDSEWARAQPREAFEYIRSRPATEPVGLGARTLAYHWLKNDAETAKQLLLPAIDADARMAPVIFPLVQKMMVLEVPASMELAQRIPDPEEKHAALKQGLMRWARIDPAAVDAYVERHPVSPSLQRSIAVAKSLSGAKRARIEGGAADAESAAAAGEGG